MYGIRLIFTFLLLVLFSADVNAGSWGFGTSVSDESYNATTWNGDADIAPSKNAVRDKIETISSALVSDTVYGAGWNGTTGVAPSKNAVYDKIETVGSASVSDESYNATTWNGVTAVAPSKNAVRDKIEILGDSLISDDSYNATTWDGDVGIAPSKNAVRDKIETVGSASVSDAVYGAGWNGTTGVAPSKNAVYDKIETVGSASVSDESYNATSWNGVTTISPSKNAMRDKIETMGGGNVNTAGVPVDDDFAKFSDATHIEGRSYSEVRSDLNIEDGATADQTGDEIVSAVNASASIIDDNNIASTIARDSEVNAKVSDVIYGAGWDGNTTIAPSKNAVYDKIETVGSASVSDAVYGAGWNGVAGVAPSKNAVYDKIETMGGGGDVIGPGTNHDGYIPLWDGINSKTLADGIVDYSSNWNMAYGWGNHDSAGYLTTRLWTDYSGVNPVDNYIQPDNQSNLYIFDPGYDVDLLINKTVTGSGVTGYKTAQFNLINNGSGGWCFPLFLYCEHTSTSSLGSGALYGKTHVPSTGGGTGWCCGVHGEIQYREKACTAVAGNFEIWNKNATINGNVGPFGVISTIAASTYGGQSAYLVNSGTPYSKYWKYGLHFRAGTVSISDTNAAHIYSEEQLKLNAANGAGAIYLKAANIMPKGVSTCTVGTTYDPFYEVYGWKGLFKNIECYGPVRGDIGKSGWRFVNGYFDNVYATCGLLTCDYVFEDNYKLMSLDELSDYLEEKRSLPDMTTNAGRDDLDLGKATEELLVKTEEQALYILQLHDRVKRLEKTVVGLILSVFVLVGLIMWRTRRGRSDA